MDNAPAAAKFNCPVGLTTEIGKSAVWIRSPRTGRVLTFNSVWKTHLPPRVWGRIVKAVSAGLRVASFTSEELRKLAALKPEGTYISQFVKPVRPAGYDDRFTFAH